MEQYSADGQVEKEVTDEDKSKIEGAINHAKK